MSTANENAGAIARFLFDVGSRSEFTARRVGTIAALDGCPIRPRREAEYLALAETARPGPEHRGHWMSYVKLSIGSEEHCQRVTGALNAAMTRGLVARTRTGKGPWRYYATPKE